MKNDKIMYEFPEITAAISDSFGQVSGVKFSDVNMDGKKDILCCSNIVMTEMHGYAGYIFTGKSGQYDVSGLSKSGKL